MKKVAAFFKFHWLKIILFFLVVYLIWWLVPVRPSVILPGGGSHQFQAFSPDGQRIITSTNRTIPGQPPDIDRHTNEGPLKLWKVAKESEHQLLTTKLESVGAITFAPNGTFMTVAGFNYSIPSPMMELWDVSKGVIQRKLEVDYRGSQTLYYTGPISRFTPDGKTLAVICPQQQIKLLDTETGQVRATFPQASRMALSHDGQQLATSLMKSPDMVKPEDKYPVHVWNVSNGQLLTTLPGHQGPTQALAFSQDGKHLATGTPGYQGSKPPEVKLWNLATGKEEFAVSGHLNADTDIRSLSFEGKGRILCMRLSLGQVRLWDWQVSPLQLLPIECDDVAFSDDGALMAYSNFLDILGKKWETLGGKPGPTREESQAVVSVWDTGTLKELSTFRPDWPIGSTRIVGFVPRSHSLMLKGSWLKDQAGPMYFVRRLAQGRVGEKWLDESELKLFDAHTGREQGVLAGNYDVHFAPDGNHLIAQDLLSRSDITLFKLPLSNFNWLLWSLWAGAAFFFFVLVGRSERRRLQTSLQSIETAHRVVAT